MTMWDRCANFGKCALFFALCYWIGFFSSSWCHCTLFLAHIYSGFILSVHLNNIALLFETNRAWLLLLLFCFFCSLVTHIFSFFFNSFCLEAKNIVCLYSDIVITMASYKRDTQQRKLIAMNFSCSWIIFATFFFFCFYMQTCIFHFKFMKPFRNHTNESHWITAFSEYEISFFWK